ncbi:MULTISPECIES: hypothetical protein, partial [unclassified Streptococcus]|uniref:hypothetical protein n=1 Tax=unclassified Streptococcus TaxID=2608887 RepID=UPI001430B41A
ITIQVALHLQDYLDNHNASSTSQILIVDKISILTRVSTITGHKSPDSLLPYIDLAWEYLATFKPVDKAREIARLLNESAVHVRTLGKTARSNSRMTKGKIIDSTVMELLQLERRIRQLIDPPSSSRKPFFEEA